LRKKSFGCGKMQRGAPQKRASNRSSTLVVLDFCSALLQPKLVGANAARGAENLRQKACIRKKCGILCGRPSGKDAVVRSLATGMGQSFQLDFSEAGTTGLKSLDRNIQSRFFAQQDDSPAGCVGTRRCGEYLPTTRDFSQGPR
jgi:hypothetical protein